MFSIDQIVIISNDGDNYCYKLKPGINYFIGNNASGKTEFYNFIDFMFGAFDQKYIQIWQRDNLSSGVMYIQYNHLEFRLERGIKGNVNYFEYANNRDYKVINNDEYRDKINSLFCQNIEMLKEIRTFTGEDLTFRTFTMFNFLGERGQGSIQDFFDKCSNIKYSIKLDAILNFIFNNNLKKIKQLQDELLKLTKEVKDLEKNKFKAGFIEEQINSNLILLGDAIAYNGKNSKEIKKYINELKKLNDVNTKEKRKDITELEIIYNSLSNQITQYKKQTESINNIKNTNINRRKIIEQLDNLIMHDQDLKYLVEPINNMLIDINDTILFSDYVTKDKTVEELKKQRKKIKDELKRRESDFKVYSLEEKSKAVAIVEELLDVNNLVDDELLAEKKKQISNLKKEIKILQNLNDEKKVDDLSKYITDLYNSAKEISPLIMGDTGNTGFKIRYIKKGNILQPIVLEDKENSGKIAKEENFYIGSMARLTLIQLCGYLGFLKLLISENKYPLIPIFVIDHISKPFDNDNKKAIGKIINEAYETIGKENLQTIIFDDEPFEALSITPDNYENLVSNNKTGFNPWHIQMPEN